MCCSQVARSPALIRCSSGIISRSHVFTITFLFVFISWSIRLTPVSGLTILKDDRVYRFVGQSNQLLRHKDPASGNESIDRESEDQSLIPETISPDDLQQQEKQQKQNQQQEHHDEDHDDHHELRPLLPAPAVTTTYPAAAATATRGPVIIGEPETTNDLNLREGSDNREKMIMIQTNMRDRDEQEGKDDPLEFATSESSSSSSSTVRMRGAAAASSLKSVDASGGSVGSGGQVAHAASLNRAGDPDDEEGNILTDKVTTTTDIRVNDEPHEQQQQPQPPPPAAATGARSGLPDDGLHAASPASSDDAITGSQPPETVADRTGIPDRVFIQINHVASVDEFLHKFVEIDDPHHRLDAGMIPSNEGSSLESDDHDEVYVESLFRGYGSPESSGSSSSVPNSAATTSSTTSTTPGRRPSKKVHPVISSPAGCDVEMRTIEIKDPFNPMDLYYPWCVRIGRCSGCCPSSRLQCVPTNISIVEINAVKLYFAKFNEKFKFEGMHTFKLEKHESCRCECVQQSSDCNEHQEYHADECRCVCRDQERGNQCSKHKDKVWIQNSCECKCRHRQTCTTGTIFSDETCRCEVSQEAVNQFSFKQFPLIHFHSSIDLEIQKQQDFASLMGSSRGINPDGALQQQQQSVNRHSFNQFVLQDQSHHQNQGGGGGGENHLYIIPSD